MNFIEFFKSGNKQLDAIVNTLSLFQCRVCEGFGHTLFYCTTKKRIDLAVKNCPAAKQAWINEKRVHGKNNKVNRDYVKTSKITTMKSKINESKTRALKMKILEMKINDQEEQIKAVEEKLRLINQNSG